MLSLHQITKVYGQGENRVEALKDVNICFRANEFVAILGHSGCGKTTLLNLIGGLDQYTGGDLLIAGRSTKEYKDRDWDTYRNHTIGFVFQSYNLIPHQSVLANVELALTLSGVSKSERRRRAAEALKQVGLGDQLHKKPNQMSGGQMQRVAIARALVNDPEILLADEPTGALDSETSVQVMEILKEVAKNKLVIMVTHNPELAQQYATRTVRLKDGRIISDSDPFQGEIHSVKEEKQIKKTSMSMATALGLSLRNLMTKKTRTLLTAFAGAIGIIGIALILALSNGIQDYINRVQEDTLASYPIEIQGETVDMTAMMTTMMGAHGKAQEAREPDGKVYASTVMYDMMNSMNTTGTQKNDLKSLKTWLDDPNSPITPHLSAMQYTYDLNMDIYARDPKGEIVKSDVLDMMQDSLDEIYGQGASGLTTAYLENVERFGTMEVWQEMLPGSDGQLVSDLLREQYDLVYGQWPQAYDQVVLVVNERNELPDLMLYPLGLKEQGDMSAVLKAAMNQEQIEKGEEEAWSYEELCGLSFRMFLPSQCYEKNADGTYTDLRSTKTGMEFLYASDSIGTTLKVVGVIRPSEDAAAPMLMGAVAYTSALTEYVLDHMDSLEVLNAQLAEESTDVLTGLPFPTGEMEELSGSQKREAVIDYISQQTVGVKADLYRDAMGLAPEAFLEQTAAAQMEGLTRETIESQVAESYSREMGVEQETVMEYIAKMSDEDLFANVEGVIREQAAQQYRQNMETQLASMTAEALAMALDQETLSDDQYVYLYDNYMPPTVSDSTYEDNLKLLGYVDRQVPSAVRLYAATFEDKDAVGSCLEDYNNQVEEEQKISYTDYVALLMSSVTTMIDAISYVLIAFVAISLVVSSIMIGIITYISVLERTKEIGILRAMGASKGDISRVFNAETMIEGFVSGAMGIAITLLLILPINALIRYLTDIPSIGAALPWPAALILVAISMGLTLLAGLVPSRIAAKKDPVEALRTE